jgi:hypothetical protein
MKKCLWLVVAVVAVATAASANLLLNPGFTDGGGTAQIGSATINNWSHWGNSGWYNDDIGGNLSVKAWWDDTGIYQDWNCSPNTAYELSVDAQQRTGDSLVNWWGYLKVEFYDSSNTKLAEQELDYITSADSLDTWIPLSGIYTSPANSAYGRTILGITHWAENPAGASYFDNASVIEAIPEPAIAGLLLVGVVGLRMLRKRA